MAKLLIAYASQEGQTERIARRLAGALSAEGHRVTVAPYASVTTLAPSGEPYDAVVVGASVHVGSFPAPLTRWVRDVLVPALGALPRPTSAFFSVCLAAARCTASDVATVERYHRTFLDATGWSPPLVASFGGALRYRSYGFIQRQMMRMVARDAGLDQDTSVDHEYTDWDEVAAFAAHLGQALGAPAGSAPGSEAAAVRGPAR